MIDQTIRPASSAARNAADSSQMVSHVGGLIAEFEHQHNIAGGAQIVRRTQATTQLIAENQAQASHDPVSAHMEPGRPSGSGINPFRHAKHRAD